MRWTSRRSATGTAPMVLRRCRRLLRDEDEALDACQDVFVRVLEHRGRLDVVVSVEPAVPDRHQRLPESHPRSRARRPTTRDEAPARVDRVREVPGARSEARLFLDWLFGRQPESSRTIAVLHFVDGLTLEEVARQTRTLGVGRAETAAEVA